MLAHGDLLDGSPEARPAGAGIELGIGREQRRPAARATERALALLAVERAREGALGAVLPGHVILLGRELLFPLGLGLADADRGLGVHPGSLSELFEA